MPSRTGSVPHLDPVLPIWRQTTVRDTAESTQPSQNEESPDRHLVTEIHDASVKLDKMREILGRLRKWHSWETERRSSLGRYLLRTWFPRRPPCPSHDELKDLATFFFALRKLLKVTICDLGVKRFERHETTIGDLEPYLQVKPSWAIIRWIHVPVGLGHVHDSIKKRFSMAGPGELVNYLNAPHALACEVVSLRDRQYLQDQLDVFNILQGFKDLTHDLDGDNLPRGMGSNMKSNVRTTAMRLGIRDDFWQLGASDIPWQLGEGLRSSLLDVDLGTNPVVSTVEEQRLSRHPRYQNAALVRSLFQTYQRSDGFVLTLSPLAGISYLDKTFLQEIQARSVTRAANESASFVSFWANRHAKNRLTISQGSPELFVVGLLTALLTTPHGRHHRTIPGVQEAYMPLTRELKTRRGAVFKHHGSVNLVREYIACMDEISQIYGISERKIDFLERLKKDCIKMQEDGVVMQMPTASPPETRQLFLDMIDGAMSDIKEDNQRLPNTINELRNSLDDLFQLRTIEQNELAIIAESNSKAILVFTVVTIVFLPLSFFTSYFGMNFKDGYDLLESQGYFWGVCGSITLVIVAFTLIYGFKDRLYGWLWSNRHSPLDSTYQFRRR